MFHALMIRTGRGRYRGARLHEVCDVAATYKARQMVGAIMSAPATTREFLRNQLQFREAEAFACCFLDNRHRLLSFEILFKGTIDGASVHPREVVKRALEHNAAALILAHNHPSGVAEASQADQLITKRIRDALAMVDIRVLDHIIIGSDATLSFAERGLL